MIDLAADMANVFADPTGIGEDATYSSGSSSLSVRAMRVAPEVVTVFGDAYVGSSIDVWLLRVADVAQPRAGDVLTVGAETYTIQGVPVRSADTITWRVETWRGVAIILDRQITLKRGPDPSAPATLDDFGQPIQLPTDTAAWPDIATVEAAFAPVSVDERWRAGMVEPVDMARFTIRYSAALGLVTGRDRVVDGNGIAWSITGAVEIGRSQWIEIAAERVIS